MGPNSSSFIFSIKELFLNPEENSVQKHSKIFNNEQDGSLGCAIHQYF